MPISISCNVAIGEPTYFSPNPVSPVVDAIVLSAPALSFPIAVLLLISNAAAQEAERYEPVNAPYAQKLVQKAMAAHQEMLVIGLHAIPPGKADNLIIACNDPAKIGKVSTSLDMDLAKTKGTKVQFNEKHKYYEVDQWFGDLPATSSA